VVWAVDLTGGITAAVDVVAVPLSAKPQFKGTGWLEVPVRLVAVLLLALNWCGGEGGCQ
jgi:hypothetical protein